LIRTVIYEGYPIFSLIRLSWFPRNTAVAGMKVECCPVEVRKLTLHSFLESSGVAPNLHQNSCNLVRQLDVFLGFSINW